MTKVACLYWDSNKTCKIIYKRMKEGTVKHKVDKEKKTFLVDKVKPYWFWKKKLLGHQPLPLYVLRHDNTVPYLFEWHQAKQTDKKAGYSKSSLRQALTPDNMTSIMEQKSLKTLLNLSGASMKDNFMWLLIGACIALPIGIIISKFIGF